eukprot:m.112097 g.112097  ORF g.112097 m.112097 type:complete len:136 (-) comp17029_c0_seq4:247-654(-)
MTHFQGAQRSRHNIKSMLPRSSKSMYVSISDYMLGKILGYELETNDSGLLFAVKPAGHGSRFIWYENDFPYNLEEGIHHHIIWCESGTITDEELQKCLDKHRKGYECVHFTNPRHLMSVPELFHVQVFSRRSHAR